MRVCDNNIEFSYKLSLFSCFEKNIISEYLVLKNKSDSPFLDRFNNSIIVCAGKQQEGRKTTKKTKTKKNQPKNKRVTQRAQTGLYLRLMGDHY